MVLDRGRYEHQSFFRCRQHPNSVWLDDYFRSDHQWQPNVYLPAPKAVPCGIFSLTEFLLRLARRTPADRPL